MRGKRDDSFKGFGAIALVSDTEGDDYQSMSHADENTLLERTQTHSEA